MNVETWLTTLGLERYGQAFCANDVNASVLDQLTDDDLKVLGVNSLGHRKTLLAAIAELGVASVGAAQSSHLENGHVPLHTQAERRHLNVMFVDLVGSTPLSLRLDPEDMLAVIRSFQTCVKREIGRFDGHIALFLGDGVLAYFGWPKAHENEAERAVRAGLAITQAVAALQIPGGEKLQVRVGIATGLVVVGDHADGRERQEQSAVGDTPNLAARLQASAGPGEVVISQTTRHLIGDIFALRDLGHLELKGIDHPVAAFAVRAPRLLESRFAARQGGGLTPIVGRDQELELLKDRWERAKDGDGHVVLLSGEAGIGKSRVAEALVESVARAPHFLMRYQCSPYHADSALYPAIQQLGLAARFLSDDSTDVRLDKLESLLKRASDDTATTAPLIAALLGIDGDHRYGPLTLAPQQRRKHTLAALADQLTALARRKPVLWVIEDAHWIDPTTMELIELSLDRVQGERLMILITARPTFAAPFASHPVVSRLALNRLARAASQAIVTRIARGKHLPAELTEEIAARSDGVPLFIEEMTKAVIESGMLRETAGAFVLEGSLGSLAIPTTLHDSLMARLDQLHPVKETAQIGAVIGRSFDHKTIAALSGLPEGTLRDALQRLVEAELIFRRGAPPEASYLFKHALVRDAAYESLLKTRRSALHAHLLEVLEDVGNAAPEIKAQHAEAAGLFTKALDYWEEAGKRAVTRPAFSEAIASFRNAIRLCGTLGDTEGWQRREQHLQIQIGQALTAKHGYMAIETDRAFERALVLADRISDVSLQLPAIFGKWAGQHIGATGSAELANRFAALAETQDSSGPRLIGLRMMSLEAFFASRFRESLAITQQSLDTYDQVAHADLQHRFAHDPRAAVLNYKAWNLWYLGFPDQAALAVQENLAWVREIKHANSSGLALCYGATVVNIWLRRPEQVESAAREALRLAEELSLALWHAWAQVHLGWALYRQGLSSGIEEIEAGLAEADAIGAGRLKPLHLMLAADALTHAGRTGDAAEKVRLAFATLDEGHHSCLAAEMYRYRADLLLRADASQRDRAEADLRQALEIAVQQDALSLQLRAASDLATLWAQLGHRQRAIDLLTPVLARFTEGFDLPDLSDAFGVLQRLQTCH